MLLMFWMSLGSYKLYLFVQLGITDVDHATGIEGFCLNCPLVLQEGFWKWLSGVTDNSVYPVMFLSYLQQVWPVLEGGASRM